MIVEEGKIAMDPLKLGGIQDWPIPKTVKQVRSFLGFGNFYRPFINHFSKMHFDIHQSIQISCLSLLNHSMVMPFDILKKKFMEEPVLMILDHSKPFKIKSNA